MNILIVDSSKKRAYIECVNEDRFGLIELNDKEKHSENLLVKIDECLNNFNIELKLVDIFGVVIGPGSFTGIRVGLSTIKGFNKYLNKKIVSINAFEPFLKVVKDGIVLLNSTSTSFYYADVVKSKIAKMGLVTINDLDKLLLKKNVYMLDYEKFKELEKYDITYISNYEELLRDIILKKCNEKDFTSDVDLEPLYLQLSQAEVNLNGK